MPLATMIITNKNRSESHAVWEALLDSDERVVWKGHSDGAVVWTLFGFFLVHLGIFNIVFLLFILYSFYSIWPFSGLPFSDPPASIVPYIFAPAGLFQFALGVYLIVVRTWWPAYQRKRSLYILTNRRAIIMTDIPLLEKKANSYPITRDTILEFESKDPGSIYFSNEPQNTSNPIIQLSTIKTGFERIPDAAQVYYLLRSVQRGED